MFVKNSTKKYDVVLMNAFKYENGTYIIPEHLTTQKFFKEVKSKMKDDGIFSVMIVENTDFIESEYKTLESVWKNVYAFDCRTQIIIATDKELDLEKIPKTLADTHYEFETDMEAIVFTDEFTPINPLEEVK